MLYTYTLYNLRDRTQKPTVVKGKVRFLLQIKLAWIIHKVYSARYITLSKIIDPSFDIVVIYKSIPVIGINYDEDLGLPDGACPVN
jgi:hypothetical protein